MRLRSAAVLGLLALALATTVHARSKAPERLEETLRRELGLTKTSTELAESLAALDRERSSLEYTATVLDHAARESMRRLDAYRSRRTDRETTARNRARSLYKLSRGGVARLAFESAGDDDREAELQTRILRGRALRFLVRHDLGELEVYRRAEERAASELVAASREMQTLGAITMVGAVQEHALVSAEHAINPDLRATMKSRRRLADRLDGEMSHEHKVLLRNVKRNWRSLRSLRGLDGAPRLVRPVQGRVVGRFGPYTDRVLELPSIRNGVELHARRDEPVKAMADGRVVMVTALPGYEQVVVLDHGGGQYTLTARLWDIAVEEGQEVEGGTLLGRVASKALDDGLGSSVYIELRHGEKPVDPTAYLKRARRSDR
ncbi:MAG: murein hydrolase activator EnvC family protein [Nannocystales bacterium]